jgi:hypothetical protein
MKAGVRLAIRDSLALATVVLLNDLGAQLSGIAKSQAGPRFWVFYLRLVRHFRA